MELVVAVLHRYTCIPVDASHMSVLGIPRISHVDISHNLLRWHYYVICNFHCTGRLSVLDSMKKLRGRLHSTSPPLIEQKD